MSAEKAIFELLKNLVSGRVYSMVAPQNATAPFIIYQRVSSDRWRSVNGPSGIAQASIQIDVYDESYHDCKTLAAQIENILDGYRDTVYYGSNSPQESIRIAGISLEGENDIFDQTEEPFLYRNLATYLVTYEQ